MPSLFHRSFLSVDLFFLMSGLVIARSYEAKILSGGMTIWGFCRTRLIRLYPLYIIGTLLGFIYAIVKSRFLTFSPFDIWSAAAVFVLNAGFIPNVIGRKAGIFPFDPAAWSLSLECLANLIYVLWMVRQSIKRVVILTMMSSVALAFCAISYGSIDMGWGASTALGGGLRICFAFTLGVLIWRLLSANKLRIPHINPIVLLALLTFFILTPAGSSGVYYDLFCVSLVFPAFCSFRVFF